MLNFFKLFVVFFIFFICVYIANSQNIYEVISVPERIDSISPNFIYLDDFQKSFYDKIGNRVAIFNFWRKDCSGCKAEMADLCKISKELDPNKYVVIGFTYDPPDISVPTIESWNVIFDNFYGNNSTIETNMTVGFLEAPFLPQTIIIDQNKKMVNWLFGAQTYDNFMQAILQVPTGINPESENVIDIKILTDRIYIHINNKEESLVSYSIFDIYGKIVFTNENYLNTIIIPTNNGSFSNGIYFLKMVIGEKLFLRKLIIFN